MHADHAGHLVLLLCLKICTSNNLESKNNSLNKNLLIAQVEYMEMVDAMEDGHNPL